MKKRILSLMAALLLIPNILSGCQLVVKTHKCSQVCSTCQKCLNPACAETACFEKCQCNTEPAAYQISLQPITEVVDLHSDLQKAYLNDVYTSINSYATGKNENSIPKALTLQWQTTANVDDAEAITSYILEISPDENFAENVWTYSTTNTEINIYNLMVGYTYYWRIKANLENNTKVVSDTSSFITAANAPRNLFVEGVTNVRDIGGWQTLSGNTVKQGMIYRCGRLNKSNQSSIETEITDNGKYTMLEQLGIRTEIDIRMVSNGEVGGLTDTSPLGSDVQYVQCPMDYTAGNLISNNRQQLQPIFAILSDSANYPVIIHCNIGTDRTGVITFLINGLVGVPEELLYRDYLFSNFGNIGGSRNISDIQNNYVNYIKSFEGDTLSQKIYNCLSANGIPIEYLDSLMSILR